jgi:hypothetical protein
MTRDIQRYDPNWDEGVQDMEKNRYGDWVEFSDHEAVVGELEGKIDRLQKAVNEAYEALRGEVA